LVEDWTQVRADMLMLLRLAQEFTAEFGRAKRELGGVDFADLEQFALRLLWDVAVEQPTAIARRWREELNHVFVDEVQDINAAQDAILRALSREGSTANRFLVGDVKQSIYRFRLANRASLPATNATGRARARPGNAFTCRRTSGVERPC